MDKRKQIAGQLRGLAGCDPSAAAAELMREAADLLDPPELRDTLGIRFLVRVDRDEETGRLSYHAAGWNDIRPTVEDAPDDVLRDEIDEWSTNNGTWTETPRWSVVRARVPVPLPTVEVEGTVEP